MKWKVDVINRFWSSVTALMSDEMWVVEPPNHNVSRICQSVNAAFFKKKEGSYREKLGCAFGFVTITHWMFLQSDTTKPVVQSHWRQASSDDGSLDMHLIILKQTIRGEYTLHRASVVNT